MAEKNLILVSAESRCLVEAYGLPPAGTIIECNQPLYEGDPCCAPKRGAGQTDKEWYAEQESRHGIIASNKANRPKTLWQRVTNPAKQQEPAKQEPLQLPARQQPQLSVQQQIRQRLQLTDKSNAIPTESSDGIHWVVFNREKQDA